MNQAVATKPKPQAKPAAPATEASPTKIAEAIPPLQTAGVERKVEQLGPARMKPAEFLRTCFLASAAPGTEPQDLEVPSYWAHVARELKPMARIEVWPDDNAWMAECVVLGATNTEAIVKVLGAWDLNGHQLVTDRADSALAAYRVEFRGHFERWGVIRKVDSLVVHTGEATEGGAYAWLKERLKAGI